MTIAVDFDGTIVEHKFPLIGSPKPFAFDVLKALAAEGHHLILWSNREGKKLEEAVEYCRQNGLEFFAVNSEYPDAAWSGSGVTRKIIADLYIDDKNVGGLPDWGEIYSIVMKKSGKNSVLDSTEQNRHANHHHKKHFKMPSLINLMIERAKDARKNFRLNDR